MSICVICNPHAGRPKSQRRLERFRVRYKNRATFWSAEGPGDAIELARRAAEQGFRVVAAAGGDGTVHEVANGLLAVNQRESTLAVIPIGSANDYAYSLKKQFGSKQLDDDQGSDLDIGFVRSSTGRERFFVESIGIGLNAQVTLESSAIERQGLVRYGLAAYRALSRDMNSPELQLGWDDQVASKSLTLMVSLLIGRREGNFLLAPKAVLNDGLFDFVHVRRLTRWQAVRMLPRLACCGPPKAHPEIRLGRCRSLKVQSNTPLAIHADGEMFCTPPDDITDVDIQLQPNRLRVKVVSH